MKRHIIPIFVASAVTLLSFTAVAHAAGAVEPANGSLLDLLKPVWDAFAHGQYLYAASISLVMAVALVRRYEDKLGPFGKWANTDLGSAALIMLGSFGGSLSASLASGAGATWGMVWNATRIAVGAAGGYTMIKHLIIGPYLRNLAVKGPAWIHTPANLVLWVFQEQLPPRAVQVATSGNTPAPPSAQ